ncbi:hypothetical protein ACE0DR_17075 [Azotobacter sp. CWF10]
MDSMQDESLMAAAVKLNDAVREITGLVNSLKDQLAERKITAKLAEHLNAFEARLADFEKAYASKLDFDRISKCADHVKTYAIAIAQAVKSGPDGNALSGIAASILNAANELAASIDDRETIYRPNKSNATTPAGTNSLSDDSKRAGNLERRNNELIAENEELRQGIATSSRKLTEIEGRIENLYSQVKEKLDQTNALYDSTLTELKKKEQEIGELVGVASGNVIAGSYENSAIIEKKWPIILDTGRLYAWHSS